MGHSADSATQRFYSLAHLKPGMELETQRSGDRRGGQARAVSGTGANNAQWAMGWIALMAIGSLGASGPAIVDLNPTRQRGKHLSQFGNEEPLLARRAGTARQAESRP